MPGFFSISARALDAAQRLQPGGDDEAVRHGEMQPAEIVGVLGEITLAVDERAVEHLLVDGQRRMRVMRRQRRFGVLGQPVERLEQGRHPGVHEVEMQPVETVVGGQIRHRRAVVQPYRRLVIRRETIGPDETGYVDGQCIHCSPVLCEGDVILKRVASNLIHATRFSPLF
ncbi:UNVERIFIED_ORG: hypothetical protein GGE53_002317 [Rhizobium etli]